MKELYKPSSLISNDVTITIEKYRLLRRLIGCCFLLTKERLYLRYVNWVYTIINKLTTCNNKNTDINKTHT